MELNDDLDSLTNAEIIRRTLRRLRESNGPSFRKFGEKIGYSYATISAVESGREMMSDTLAELLDQKFDLPFKFSELLEAARKNAIHESARKYVHHEQTDAAKIEVFTSSVIPGLLQIKEYTRALFLALRPWENDEKIATDVAARMKRREILNDNKSPFYWAIIDESAIKRPVGDDACMRDQLAHLIEASNRRGTTVQVLPFSQGGHSMMGGSANLLTRKNGAGIGIVESFKNSEPIESPSSLIQLGQLFDTVRSKALPQKESLDLIRHYLKTEYGNEQHP